MSIQTETGRIERGVMQQEAPKVQVGAPTLGMATNSISEGSLGTQQSMMGAFGRSSSANLAYISTSKGINSLRIPFGIEKENFSKVTVFPSPFFIPSDNMLRVDGLPYETNMIVMTLDGKVIRRVENRGLSIDGDQLSWDGRDDKGFYVSSGVYLLALYGSNGSNSMEKITVINR